MASVLVDTTNLQQESRKSKKLAQDRLRKACVLLRPRGDSSSGGGTRWAKVAKVANPSNVELVTAIAKVANPEPVTAIAEEANPTNVGPEKDVANPTNVGRVPSPPVAPVNTLQQLLKYRREIFQEGSQSIDYYVERSVSPEVHKAFAIRVFSVAVNVWVG